MTAPAIPEEARSRAHDIASLGCAIEVFFGRGPHDGYCDRIAQALVDYAGAHGGVESAYQAACHARDAWTEKCREAEKDVRDLAEDLREAQGNIERMKAHNLDAMAKLDAIEVERTEWTRQRVDIGNRFDLHMASCGPNAVKCATKLADLAARLETVTRERDEARAALCRSLMTALVHAVVPTEEPTR